jgi:hypothetical protein
MSVVVGTDTPLVTVAVPVNGGCVVEFSMGVPFGTGVAYAITGGIADSDTTSVAGTTCTGSCSTSEALALNVASMRLRGLAGGEAAMTYLEQYQLGASDNTFRQRVQSAILTVARDVSAEATDTPKHVQRSALAQKVALDPWAYAGIMALGVAIQPGVTAQSADADLYAAASALWNLYAGN